MKANPEIVKKMKTPITFILLIFFAFNAFPKSPGYPNIGSQKYNDVLGPSVTWHWRNETTTLGLGFGAQFVDVGRFYAGALLQNGSSNTGYSIEYSYNNSDSDGFGKGIFSIVNPGIEYSAIKTEKFNHGIRPMIGINLFVVQVWAGHNIMLTKDSDFGSDFYISLRLKLPIIAKDL